MTKTTLRDWHDSTVHAMRERRKSIQREVDALTKQIDDLNVVIEALSGVKLHYKPYKRTKPYKPSGAAKKGHTHWSKRPGADPAKVAAWKANMSKIQRKLAKSR